MVRKRWEAELQAGLVIQYLGEAMGGSSASSGAGGGYQEVSTAALLAQMGVGVE